MTDITESMIERVARAIAKTDGFEMPDDMSPPYADNSRIGKAVARSRAAIEAMRVPTTGMLAAAAQKCVTFDHHGNDGDMDESEAKDAWQTMITAALND